MRQLGTRFELDVHAQHPDRSGGLRPVGELCLINALILAVPALDLGIWILVLQTQGLGAVYAAMIPVLLVLATLVFVQPLYAIHRAIMRSRSRLRPTLDALSAEIDRLAMEQLNAAASTHTDSVKQLSERLSLLRQTYQENHDIPVWPFDKRILGKFVTSLYSRW